MTRRSAEIVVGGGAIGCSIADHLARLSFAGTDTTARGSLVSGVD
jgi:glycine/D-amino acid oxidase-like deaminating enzyme